jgi:hypothetical protein
MTGLVQNLLFALCMFANPADPILISRQEGAIVIFI